MEKLTQQLLSAQKCFHVFEIPPNPWFLAGNISFQSILVTYYSTQSCKIGKFKKRCLWKNLRNNCSLHKKCFHAFEIPPNPWFLAGNISFQSILVIYYSTQSCKIGKFKKKCLWKNLRNNCSLHKTAFMHSKYHHIPGFLAGSISLQSISVIYYSTQSCKIGKF